MLQIFCFNIYLLKHCGTMYFFFMFLHAGNETTTATHGLPTNPANNALLAGTSNIFIHL